jgi:hypothetical protein
MTGRPIAGRFHQGDVLRSFAILRRADGCAEAPDRAEDEPAGLERFAFQSAGTG